MKNAEFAASCGWFHRLKKRQTYVAQGEAAAAESFPWDLQKITDNGGYIKDEIFIVDETGLFWKMPSRTFIAKEENTVPGFKPAEDRLTLLLRANASGTLKLKCMLIYHSGKKNYARTRLPVHWTSSAKAWVTAAPFEEWFDSCFVTEVNGYCKENMPFKTLLFLDNAPGHPSSLDDLHLNVQTIFLPPKTISLLQPMDHWFTAAFKLYYSYLRRTFSRCITAIDIEEGTGQEVIKKFWKGFTILDGIKTI